MSLINCYRCGKPILGANVHNADYIETPEGVNQIICPDCYRPDDKLIWGLHKVLDTGQLTIEPSIAAPAPAQNKKPGIFTRLLRRFVK